MKEIRCTSCISLVHRKCSKLKPSEIIELQKSKGSNWECISCQSYKFLYATIDAIELKKNTFNSNFTCSCQTKTDFSTNKNHLSFNFGDGKDSPNNNFVNMTDKELDKMMLNSNFKYYDNLEFHKLKQKCSNNKNLSIFHTNICSLQANLDKF